MIRIQKMMTVENEHLYGPGKRVLIFLKGCSIHCNGCVNKHLWSFEGGKLVSAPDVLAYCKIENAVGITIHGGEPLDQACGLKELVNILKENNLTIILFTGYLKRELDKNQLYIWRSSDMVVAGRFVLEKRNVNLQFRGSKNQRVYRHKGPYKNYKLNDGYTTAIISIDESGRMDVNGFLTDDIKRLVDEK